MGLWQRKVQQQRFNKNRYNTGKRVQENGCQIDVFVLKTQTEGEEVTEKPLNVQTNTNIFVLMQAKKKRNNEVHMF